MKLRDITAFAAYVLSGSREPLYDLEPRGAIVLDASGDYARVGAGHAAHGFEGRVGLASGGVGSKSVVIAKRTGGVLTLPQGWADLPREALQAVEFVDLPIGSILPLGASGEWRLDVVQPRVVVGEVDSFLEDWHAARAETLRAVEQDSVSRQARGAELAALQARLDGLGIESPALGFSGGSAVAIDPAALRALLDRIEQKG